MAKTIYVSKNSDATVFQREDGTYFVRRGEEEIPARISISKGSAPSLSAQMNILGKKGRIGSRMFEEGVIELYEIDQPTEVPEQRVVPAAPPPQRQKKKPDMAALFRMAVESGDSVQVSVTEAPMDGQMRPVGRPVTEISRSDSQMIIAKAQMDSELRLAQHQKKMEETLGNLEVESKLQLENIERSTATKCEIIKQNTEMMQSAQELNIRKMRVTTDNHLAKIAAVNEKARMEADMALKDIIVTEEASIEKMKIQTETAISQMKEENRSKEALGDAELARTQEAQQRDYLRQKGEEDRKLAQQLTAMQISTKKTIEEGNLASKKLLQEMKSKGDIDIAEMADKHNQFETNLARSVLQEQKQRDQELSKQRREFAKRQADLDKERQLDSLKSQAEIDQLNRQREANEQAERHRLETEEQQRRQEEEKRWFRW